MRAYLGLGLSLAVAGAITPAAAFAQDAPAAPAAPAAAAAPAAPADKPAPAAEPAPAAAPGAEAAPAAAPAEAAAPAAEEKPKPAPTITGFIEGAYHGNLSNMSNDPVVGRSYDYANGNSFYLHAAHLAIAHSFSDTASAVVELDVGSDAMVTNYAYSPYGVAAHAHSTPWGANQTIPFDVQEAYGVWSPDKFVVTLGHFVTYEGIEVIEGPLNPTITRGYLFGLAEPFTHTGAKVHYKITDQIQAGVGLVNGWDTLIDNNRAKTIIWAVSAAPVDMFHAQFSGSYGSEQTDFDDRGRLSLDLTGAVVLDPVTINFQGNYGSEKNAATPGVDATGAPTIVARDDNWFGFGIQPVLTMDKFTLGGRLEYFKNKHGSRTLLLAENLGLMNFTITPGYQVADGLTLRGELRLDTATENVFARHTSPGAATPAGPEKSQVTFAIGAHYMF